jgi:hypothetical protein
MSGPIPRMRSTIEKAAQLTVVEGRNTEIRIAKWKAPDDRLRGLNVERRKGRWVLRYLQP